MSERFIKYIPSPESEWLKENHPNAFLLLTLIAERARLVAGNPDGLDIGECHIGDYKKAGISTRGQYRHALSILLARAHIKIIENCRTRKKATTGTTTVGSRVKLISSTVYDFNFLSNNHRNDHPTTTEQPPNNHEQRTRRMKKKEEQQPQTPSPEGAVVVFSCLQNLDLEEKHKAELSAKYSEAVIEDAITAISEPGFKRKGSLLQVLRAACKECWKPNKATAGEIQKNKKFAVELEKKSSDVRAYSDFIEIIVSPNSPARCVEYNMTHDLFRAKIEQKSTL